MSQPPDAPSRTSEGKCCCAMTRLALTAAAAVYTPNFAHLEWYLSAMTAAEDHATILCSETNEEFAPARPTKNSPLPLSCVGRSRQAQSLTRSLTKRRRGAACCRR